MATTNTSASYSLTLRAELENQPGALGRVTSAIGEVGGDIGAIDIVRVAAGHIIRDITINARNEDHGRQIVEHVRTLPGVQVVNVSDRTFLMHLGGKIEVANRVPVKTRDDLSMAYTPGVARVCTAIAEDPSKAFSLTIKRNSVAVVSDGSAVLGLGNIGPEGAMPVMEGKAMLFKEFGGVDAYPLCLRTQDPDEIVRAVEAIATGFGGINLEDISSPRCFYIEQKLQERLDIPVFHDDQHGTAVVVLAALLNSLKIVGKRMEDIRVVISGVGAAGIAVTRMLLDSHVGEVILVDTRGALYEGRTEGMNPVKQEIAAVTNPRHEKGDVHEVLRGADVFIGVSSPGLLTAADLESMAPDPILFALANPVPEIMPEEAQGKARVIATGRSDYANQINNVLTFPGIFRGALDCQATRINSEMKLAAARAIAETVGDTELNEEYIVPSVFNRRVVELVSLAVASAAQRTGVARRHLANVPEEEIAAIY
ncbi:MAG: NAD-dependent malic enzyme [Chloroflexota bacterium]|nr:NAD-dependent malic enzyme [Chloroflexota bacterium]